MLSTFDRKRTLLARAAFVAAVAMSSTAVVSQARANEEQLLKSGGAHEQILIREHAGWDRNCEPVAHPAIRLDRPPRHGTVCARVEAIEIRSMYTGTESQCIGRSVRGLRLIYRSHVGYAGPDGIRYSVQYPRARRDVAVTLTVTGVPGARHATPSPVAAPSPAPPQSPGAVPDCNDFVS